MSGIKLVTSARDSYVKLLSSLNYPKKEIVEILLDRGVKVSPKTVYNIIKCVGKKRRKAKWIKFFTN